ncbi:glycosyltransferase family protein [Streptomyces sp. NBC_01465]|uniref:glycosyltransferase family protein n=1 Tax=Streptomyces sp. NBC_01465 TaxID=2903878 RepID=UPI002E3222DE|nr:hypothetical protein [Streptomyces sp. NBC_01465]
MTPTVLHLSNDRTEGPHLSFGPAFASLAAQGALHHVPAVPLALLHQGREHALRDLTRIAAATRPTVLLVQSPGAFPWTPQDVAALVRAAGSPYTVLWEGDAWGGRKPLPPATAAWLAHCDAVFSVATGEQATLFARHTSAPVRYIPQTVPDRLRTDEPVPPLESAAYDAVHIGGSYVRFGLLERIDDALDRRRAITAVRRLPGVRTAVHGAGWRGPGAHGPLPFEHQVRTIRTARLSVNWDHFRRYAGFCSNRLPISLYAGRVHITSRVLDAPWLPGPEAGLHQVETPSEVADRVRELLSWDPALLHRAGLAAHDWVRDRLTNENALRHMLGPSLGLTPTAAEPWRTLAAAEAPAPHTTGARV